MKTPLLVLCALLLGPSGPAWSQSRFGENSHKTDIIVMVEPDALEVPESSDRVQLSQATFELPALRSVLQQLGAQEVLRSFPVDKAQRDTVLVGAQGEQVGLLDRSRIFRFRFPESADLDAAVEALSQAPGVVFAYRVPDYQSYGVSERIPFETSPVGAPYAVAAVVPGDEHFGRQWNLKHTGQSPQPPVSSAGRADIRAPEAWEIYKGSSQIKIGVFDSGVQINHPDLNNKTTGENGTYYHGSHVAGIAAAETNNFEIGGSSARGVAGVDWNARIVSKNLGTFDPEDIYDDVIDALTTDGVHVLNHSWGAPGEFNDVLTRSAFAAAYELNRTSVVAMGNSGTQQTNYPAALPGVIAVGSNNHLNGRSAFSTWANHIDVVAPGGFGGTVNSDDIYSTCPTSTYCYDWGTSMATPHVSGLASLLRGYAKDHLNLTLYNDDIEHLIKLSTDRLPNYSYNANGWNNEVGHGRINARAALDRLRAPYVIRHLSAGSGNDMGASSSYSMTIYGTAGLADGTYLVKRHEVRRNVGYPATQNVKVWGRGVDTRGWANTGGVNFTMGWCEPVPGTVTSTQATLRTYLYEVWTLGGTYKGWYPAEPWNVLFYYTVHGTGTPLSVSISGPSSLGWKKSGTWTATASNGPSGNYTFKWYKRIPGGSWGSPLRTKTTSSSSDAFSVVMLDYDFEIQVTVTRGSETASKTKYISYDGGPQPRISEGALTALEMLPSEYALEPNYPNPFNPTTEIRFALPEAADVRLIVYDALGREVARLVDGPVGAGYQHATFEAGSLPSGVYLYRLEAKGAAETFSKTGRMVLVK